MHITDHLHPASVALRQQADSMQAALQRLVDLMAANGNLTDPQAFAADVQAREALGGTCVGEGLAIPHAKSAAVRQPGLAALTLDPPLACDTPDGKPVRMMFLIAAPADANDLHVQVLAGLATLMLDKELCARLMDAETPEAFCRLMAEQEDAKSRPRQKKGGRPEPWRFVAVTACPTGLAHTYLAAEALQKAAQDRGVRLKVETDGAAGGEQSADPRRYRRGGLHHRGRRPGGLHGAVRGASGWCRCRRGRPYAIPTVCWNERPRATCRCIAAATASGPTTGESSAARPTVT